MVPGEEGRPEERMPGHVDSAKGLDHFKNKGTVTRLKLADKSLKIPPQIIYRIPSNFNFR